MAENKKAHKPKARANGEGTLFQRKSDGLWIGRLPVGYNPNGSVKYLKFSGKKQADVREKMDKAKTEVRTNTYVEPNKVTFGEWLDTWLPVTMKNSIKETTYMIYENMVEKHIKPALGGYKLSQLQTQHITRFYNEKQEGGRADGKPGGLSPKSIRHLHQVVVSALEGARENVPPLLSVNPAKSKNLKLPKMPKGKRNDLKMDEVAKFLKTAKTSALHKHHYAAFYLEIYTGLRRGELLGIRWRDLDLKEGTVTVVQQLVKVGSSHVIRELKTESSQNRTIFIGDDVMAVLKEHKRQQEERLKLLGYNDFQIADHFKTGLVFVNEIGTSFVQPRNFTRCFKGILKKARLQDIRLHDLRHTFVAISREAGADIATIQSDLGHESIETTIDVYGYTNAGMKRDAAKKRSKLMKKAIGTQLVQ